MSWCVTSLDGHDRCARWESMRRCPVEAMTRCSTAAGVALLRHWSDSLRIQRWYVSLSKFKTRRPLIERGLTFDMSGSWRAQPRNSPLDGRVWFHGWRLMIRRVSTSYEVHKVRTTIEIDDKLMKDALRATGAKTKREVVELGLKTLVQLRAQEKARELKGKITWEGDLNAMRTDR